MDVSGGRLSAALAEFARETGAELLFDQKLVSGFIAGPVRGKLSRRDALSRLLAGTGVGFRRAGGSFVLFRLPAWCAAVGVQQQASRVDHALP